MITVLNEQREVTLERARSSGDSLWLAREDIERATGWTWKPEGLCQADTCVPLPRASAEPIATGGMLDVAAMWRYMGHPVARDTDGATWVLGTGAEQRAQALSSLEAPDFALPDLDGRMHRLSDHRGSKVLLATWASW